MPLTTALVTTALALLGAAAIAGCGGGSTARPVSKAGATESARVAATTAARAFTASQLKSALLTELDGHKPATAAQAGMYGTLPDTRTSQQTMDGVKVTPATCAPATVSGFNSATMARAPASVLTFRDGSDGVWEILVSATPKIATAALASQLPAGCLHYSATVSGQTFHYSVTEASLAGVGEQARALNVTAAGYSSVDVWSVVYRADGFVGAVTMVGPDSSRAGARQLAIEAYDQAEQSLS